MIQVVKFKINGMHCTACAMNIDGELEDSSGVIESSTNYARQETSVKFDDLVININKIKEIIEKTGYKVQP